MKKVALLMSIFLVLAGCSPAKPGSSGDLPGSSSSDPVDSYLIPTVPSNSLVTTSSDTVAQKPPVCITSSPSSAAYSVTLCLTAPSDGDTFTGDGTVSATLDVTGISPGVRRVVFYLNGAYLLTDFTDPYTFLLPSSKWADGTYTLSVEALMQDNFTTKQASLSVGFDNGNASTPVNDKQFQPATGRPATSGQPFVVAVTGNGASGESTSTDVVNLIASQNPNLLLYLGDIYEQGSVAEFYNWYGTSSTYFGQFRSITDPAIGNDEYVDKVGFGYFDYWDNIPDYYSFNADGWHFISLDSNYHFDAVNQGSAQYKWLQQDLAANTQPCTIAYYHHPLFTIGSKTPTTAMADIWKLLAQYGVSIVLNGEDHNYQRWVPLDGNGQPSPNGITEFMVGTGGHTILPFIGTDSRVAFADDTKPDVYGALFLQLNQDSANFSYRNTAGNVLDSGVVTCVSAPASSNP